MTHLLHKFHTIDHVEIILTNTFGHNFNNDVKRPLKTKLYENERRGRVYTKQNSYAKSFISTWGPVNKIKFITLQLKCGYNFYPMNWFGNGVFLSLQNDQGQSFLHQ